MNLDAAVDTAIDEMPEGYVIRKFLVANRGEIKNMFLTEYNQEKVLEKERAEAQEETSRLFNFLWKNGRGADAEKAEKDADYRLSLLEKFRAGKLAPD